MIRMTATIKGEPPMKTSVCMGCTGVINDQYILRVSPDMEWHAACLKCADCQQFLDEFCTCFVREGKTYCKRDYVRLFGAKCDRCGNIFRSKDLVMRARTKIYHMDCFKCQACGKQLLPGDEFALRPDGLYCRLDFDSFEKKANQENNNTTNINHNEVKVEVKSGRKERRESKTTRVRTVLNEKQLQTLRTCYGANCRPDALMKEQLVEMTGLSPRVIRVWFQNKRCKDKKRAILMKQMQQEKFGSFQEKQLALQGLTGVPMVASSPIRHDGAILSGMNGPIDVRAYEAPWKNLSEFALAHEIDRIDASTPGYQHLIQQMHGYGADLCSAVDLLGPPQNQTPPSHTPQHAPQNSSNDSKFDMTHFDESVHSDSYVSYLESDDSMSATLIGARSP